MSSIRVTTLGAGQCVGRSCVVVRLGGRTIMFDCGMHMGGEDERVYPDFTFLSTQNVGKEDAFNSVVDCVIITHFHLDHVGALPFFTEVMGFSGPVFMTYPTKAIAGLMLEDYAKLQNVAAKRTHAGTSAEPGGGDKAEASSASPTGYAALVSKPYTSEMIRDCLCKAVPMQLNETKRFRGISITPFYAGHVLGAAMFEVRVGDESVVYTGDYNMTSDRHLGAARVRPLRPQILITESTYAMTVRDSKRQREREFCALVLETLRAGGKVLVPVFAVGRAQELCILLQTFWKKLQLDYPIFFLGAMTEKANRCYRLFSSWTREQLQLQFRQSDRDREREGGTGGGDLFDFPSIKYGGPQTAGNLAEVKGPLVVFATPGMLHAGSSLKAFVELAPDPKNLVVIPGYCVQGTVGHKIQNSKGREVQIDANTRVTVRCRLQYLSFSAHADSRGICTLIKRMEPESVVLVHGAVEGMVQLREKIVTELHIPTSCPEDGETIVFRKKRSSEEGVEALFSTSLFLPCLSIPRPKFEMASTGKRETIKAITHSGETGEGPIVPLHFSSNSDSASPFSDPPFVRAPTHLKALVLSLFAQSAEANRKGEEDSTVASACLVLSANVLRRIASGLPAIPDLKKSGRAPPLPPPVSPPQPADASPMSLEDHESSSASAAGFVSQLRPTLPPAAGGAAPLPSSSLPETKDCSRKKGSDSGVDGRGAWKEAGRVELEAAALLGVTPVVFKKRVCNFSLDQTTTAWRRFVSLQQGEVDRDPTAAVTPEGPTTSRQKPLAPTEALSSISSHPSESLPSGLSPISSFKKGLGRNADLLDDLDECFELIDFWGTLKYGYFGFRSLRVVHDGDLCLNVKWGAPDHIFAVSFFQCLSDIPSALKTS
uniref:Beta-Casp domain-containing protein n=1 Tax=Chromera velia CCMP2878 TaxID=1169474 RepID=A0A0G4FF16_9ALVE|eukprot:Cvel_16543.t1-p1 / transcript=Cvel_16543.t1 / gene=Cvel_16543 / organism=Chromera_velia_CCMP2878 / gene_product=Integrator complex subunit 11, putative / transcript_product=Integrator complex subunit 11, putative / location=Cvel_scaffold1278:43601-49319(+) / protein_length=884 / sequence_SO=supercontig / SO=protein_coding / is_pseudo=false